MNYIIAVKLHVGKDYNNNINSKKVGKINMDKCVIQFFDDEYQKQLKERAINNEGFEYTLRNYRDLFLEDIVKLDDIKLFGNCDHCSKCIIYNSISIDLESYMKDFCNDIRTKSNLVSVVFDEIIDIYISALSINRSIANQKLDAFILNRCNGLQANDPFFFSRPFFRARKAGDYDGSDIHELFHVPFNKRQHIGNMRFSLTGVPLLYLAESLPLALKEIDCENNKYNAALFLPKYSNYYDDLLFDMTNPFIDKFNSIQDLIDAGFDCSYKSKSIYVFTENNIDWYLARFILSQCLHFSVQNRGSFIPEYLLPQLLMDLISENDWLGIRYRSCRSLNNESRDRYMHYVDNNICFKVPYSSTNYNDDMLANFHYATWCNSEKTRTHSELDRIREEFIKLIDNAKSEGYILNDYVSFFMYVHSHIEKMIDTIGKKSYQNRKACRVEITLFYKMFEQMIPIVKNPDKYGIRKENRKNGLEMNRS